MELKRKRINIYLAEDDDGDHLIFQQALAEVEGTHKLERFSNGEQLLVFLNQGGKWPDIIFLDLNMPIMNGRETLSELKSHPVFKKIPVFILSTSRQQEEVNGCYHLGANLYIPKPFEFAEWVQVITGICALVSQQALLPAK